MKITKTEKIWLAVVLIFFLLYNLPFVPPYGNAAATILHAIVTVIPLWIAIYVGFVKVCRIYKLKESDYDSEQNKKRNQTNEKNPEKGDEG